MQVDTGSFSDDEVIHSVIGGCPQNFEILVRRYSSKIFTFIQRMIQDKDEAKSLTQDAFLKVFENLRYYRPEDNFSAFIFKIAKNLTLNQIKRGKRIILFSRLVGNIAKEEAFATAAPAADPLEAERRQRMIQAGLQVLPEEQRLALILKVYLDFSYKRIKEITGWSTPKIETLISRAKSGLKKNIRLQENPDPDVLPARKR